MGELDSDVSACTVRRHVRGIDASHRRRAAGCGHSRSRIVGRRLLCGPDDAAAACGGNRRRVLLLGDAQLQTVVQRTAAHDAAVTVAARCARSGGTGGNKSSIPAQTQAALMPLRAGLVLVVGDLALLRALSDLSFAWQEPRCSVPLPQSPRRHCCQCQLVIRGPQGPRQAALRWGARDYWQPAARGRGPPSSLAPVPSPSPH